MKKCKWIPNFLLDAIRMWPKGPFRIKGDTPFLTLFVDDHGKYHVSMTIDKCKWIPKIVVAERTF